MAGKWGYANIAGFASGPAEKSAWGKAFRKARIGEGKSIKAAATVADKHIMAQREAKVGAMGGSGSGGGIKHRPGGGPKGGQFY